MQVVAWIIIIMVIVFLIWLLRRWIKRLIFILILLVLAFLIYGIFNPSGAARLWYNVRTFPQRMASWMGSSEKYLDYDNYKLDISSIGDDIGDKIDLLNGDDENEDLDSEEKADISIDKTEIDEEDNNEKIAKGSSSLKGQTIKSFPRSVKFVKFPELQKKDNSEIIGQLTGYSKSDLLGVINKYVEKNLDDDTDILVTVEYEDDSKSIQRIILETQPKSKGNGYSVYFLGVVDELLEEYEGEKKDEVSSSGTDIKKSNNKTEVKTPTVKKTYSNKLSQKDQQEAEEIFSILF